VSRQRLRTGGFPFLLSVPPDLGLPAKSNNEMRRNEQNARCASHWPATRGGGGDGGRSHVQTAIMRNVPEKFLSEVGNVLQID
jgi:hypothetical protein